MRSACRAAVSGGSAASGAPGRHRQLRPRSPVRRPALAAATRPPFIGFSAELAVWRRASAASLRPTPASRTPASCISIERLTKSEFEMMRRNIPHTTSRSTWVISPEDKTFGRMHEGAKVIAGGKCFTSDTAAVTRLRATKVALRNGMRGQRDAPVLPGRRRVVERQRHRLRAQPPPRRARSVTTSLGQHGGAGVAAGTVRRLNEYTDDQTARVHPTSFGSRSLPGQKSLPIVPLPGRGDGAAPLDAAIDAYRDASASRPRPGRRRPSGRPGRSRRAGPGAGPSKTNAAAENGFVVDTT